MSNDTIVETPPPPAATHESEGGRARLLLRIVVDENQAKYWLLAGGDNRLGTWLLSALLKARLELAGIRIANAACTYNFNRSLYVFEVGDAAAGLGVLVSALSELSLLDYAHIGWEDGQGVTQYLPSWGEFPMPTAQEQEDLRQESERLRREIAVMKELAGRLMQSTQNGPDS